MSMRSRAPLAIAVACLFFLAGACRDDPATSTGVEGADAPETPQVEEPKAPTYADKREQHTLEVQKRANRYFHTAVIPRLRPCWSALEGEGTVAFKHDYRNETGSRWRSQHVSVHESTLDSAQTAAALECMQKAAEGTSFEAEPAESFTADFALMWSWPVPLPSLPAESLAAMLAAGGGGSSGGCDGKGAPKKCHKPCEGAERCKSVCVGYKKCSDDNEGGKRVGCTYSGKCASGGPFGLEGRLFIQ